MNVKRFTARTSRDALAKVRAAFGEDAVVLSTRPSPEGVEVLAMPADGVESLERRAPELETVGAPPAPRRFVRPEEVRGQASTASVQGDVERLAMSTLSFQDYVRERVLKRRQAAMQGEPEPSTPPMPPRAEQALREAVQPAAVRARPAAPEGASVRRPPAPVRQAVPRVAAQRLREPGLGDAMQAQSSPWDRRTEPQMGGMEQAVPGWSQGEPQGIERLVERHVERHVDPRMPPTPAQGMMQPPMPPAVQPAAQASAPHGYAPHPAMAPQAMSMQAPQAFSQQVMTHAAPHHPQAMAPAPQVMPHVWPQAGHPAPQAMPQQAVAQPRQAEISLQDRYTDEAARVAQVRVDREQQAMLHELRAMKGMIEERFGTLAYMERMQRHPELARLVQRLMDCGFSPALVRRLTDQAPTHLSDLQGWAIQVLEANLRAAESEQPLEDQGGIVAMIGSTGVGKTTSTAKLAAAFAAKHGAANLGLITLDAYRVGAHEQLRSYGRILGVAVHTAHDRQALEDMLDLLSNKRMVLIDTAGIAQRDSRTQELLETLGHRSIEKLLVVNASAQGETIEDVLISYRASQCKGVVLSKIDEAVKLAPALDAVIRHRLKVMAVANGQRVPEDWHRLSAQALIHRALRGGGSAAYRFDSQDVNLLLATPPQQGMVMGGLHA